MESRNGLVVLLIVVVMVRDMHIAYQLVSLWLLSVLTTTRTQLPLLNRTAYHSTINLSVLSVCGHSYQFIPYLIRPNIPLVAL